MAERGTFTEDWAALTQLETDFRPLKPDIQPMSVRRDPTRATRAVQEMARATAQAESRWSGVRGVPSADSRTQAWRTERLNGRTVDEVVRDLSLMQDMRASWLDCLREPIAREPEEQVGAYDRFVAFEVGLLVDLGIPVSRAWTTVRLAFPSGVDRASRRPGAYRLMLQEGDAQYAMRARSFTLSMTPVSWAVQLQALAQEDPADPSWSARVRRAMRRALVQGALAVVESADGLAREPATLLSVVLAALRAAMEVGDEDPEVTDTGVFAVVGGVLSAVDSGLIT